MDRGKISLNWLHYGLIALIMGLGTACSVKSVLLPENQSAIHRSYAEQEARIRADKAQSALEKSEAADQDEAIETDDQASLPDDKLKVPDKDVEEMPDKTQPGRKSQTRPESKLAVCANTRIEQAYQLQSLAKNYLSEYYKYRAAGSLYKSWYALEDSNHLATTVARCDDKRNRHFFAVENIVKQNSTLEKLIAINNRPGLSFEARELFLDDFHKISPRTPRP